MQCGYRLIDFGNALRSIRMRLHYTHQGVYNATGIHRDTMRKLENGIVIPKIETLEILSKLFHTNLLVLFDTFRVGCNPDELYYAHEKSLLIGREDEVKTICSMLIEDLQNTDTTALEIEQFEYFIEGLLHYNESSISAFYSALKIKHSSIDMNNFNTYNLNRFDRRILFHLANRKSELRASKESNILLSSLMATLDMSSQAPEGEKILLSKTFFTLSDNHLKLSCERKAFSAANAGIHHNMQNGMLYFLSDLLEVKAKSMHRLCLEGADALERQALALKNLAHS